MIGSESVTKERGQEEEETYRLVPNACQAKGKPTECKHGAPWECKMNHGDDAKPLLICPGIAKERGLRGSGTRNMIGSTLFLRNSEWLNGTIAGFCIAFAGSNSDVQPNDMLPITSKTHEDTVCKRNCVKKRNLKKLTKKVVRIQSTRNGYFGGYINKRQLVGSLETKKCVDKMYTLRDRIRGRSEQDKLRAVTGRMITDIEMNGTIRGAVEVYNLASHLRNGDALFAESIRTFPTRDVDARAWLHRLALEVQAW